MLVCDAPVAIDLAQANSQPEQKAVLFYRIAGRVRSAPHDGDREGDVSACGNGEFSKVEGRIRLVITEKQIPGLFVGFDAPALKWRRQVEHHHVPRVVRKNGGKIVFGLSGKSDFGMVLNSTSTLHFPLISASRSS